MVIINLKRSQWDVYTDTPDSVIETVNGYFSYVIANNKNANDAQQEIYKLMCMYSEWGFVDSEPLQSATDTINNVYNTKLTRWDSQLS
mgnify:CR=1 FL=1